MPPALDRLRAAMPEATIVRAPGRVNLIGGHVDYHEGVVVAMAVNQSVYAAYISNDEGIARIRSFDFDTEVAIPVDRTIDPQTIMPTWGRLAGGVVQALQRAGEALRGVDVIVGSDLPIGAGLSSSAAFEVALTSAMLHAVDRSLPPHRLAEICQTAELLGSGVACGLQDQTTSISSRVGFALRLDCRDQSVAHLPIPREAAVVIIDSAVTRTLAGSPWGQRRAESFACAQALGLRVLRDATLQQVADNPRGRHVVAEIARVEHFASALRRGDLQRAGALMLESHASSRDNFESSTSELDLLVELSMEAGAFGARLTGGGFGGCVVALVPKHRAEHIAIEVEGRYRAATRLRGAAMVVQPGEGTTITRGDG